MRRIQRAEQIKRAEPDEWTRRAALATLFLLTAGEVLAQDRQSAGLIPAGKLSTRPERRIVVSIPDRKLALLENGRVVKVYRVAVGAPDSLSPAGEFRVVQRLVHPAYYAPGLVIPAGPDNPLGPRWIGLDRKSYGIHGTDQPRSIGHRASHGCIRMRNRDVRELFEFVRRDDVVELHGERDAVVARVFGAEAATLNPPSAESSEAQRSVAVVSGGDEDR